MVTERIIVWKGGMATNKMQEFQPTRFTEEINFFYFNNKKLHNSTLKTIIVLLVLTIQIEEYNFEVAVTIFCILIS
jgi:predicted nucleotidyltransferase component of viral defense system